jgi:hypothetical protein
MSLQPGLIPPVPENTAQVVRAAFSAPRFACSLERGISSEGRPATFSRSLSTMHAQVGSSSRCPRPTYRVRVSYGSIG